jgi:outer membrane protein assembly factor BamD
MYKNGTFTSCFEVYMKNAILVLMMVLALASCSEYQKVLKGVDNEAKLVMIDTLMNRGKYTKAIVLFDQVEQQYRGTDKAPELALKYGEALFADGMFPTSAGQFERYADAYAFAPKVEYALFMEGKSYANMVAVFSRDQLYTNKAITKLQDYINNYPNGEYVSRANDEISDLRFILDQKAYEIAKNNHHRDAYIPAIATLENFIEDHPGSSFQDDAHFYLLDAQYSYAENSVYTIVPKRLEKAKKYYDTFVKRFPDSEYKERADKIMTKITEYKPEFVKEETKKDNQE